MKEINVQTLSLYFDLMYMSGFFIYLLNKYNNVYVPATLRPTSNFSCAEPNGNELVFV